MNKENRLSKKEISAIECWGKEIVLDPSMDINNGEVLLEAAFRYGGFGSEAYDKCLLSIYKDAYLDESSALFDWIDSIAVDRNVFVLSDDFHIMCETAKTIFKEKLRELSDKGFIRDDYNARLAYLGFVGRCLCAINDAYFTKFDAILGEGEKMFYTSKGIFNKEYHIIALPQYDDVALADVKKTEKYNRLDSYAIIDHVMRMVDTEEEFNSYMEYVKSVVTNPSYSKLADAKCTLEKQADSSRKRKVYAYLYAAVVLRHIYGE